MGRVIQFPAQNENLWLRRHEDGTIEIGIDDKGSWVWLLSLSLNDEGEFVIQDYVYHDALPDIMRLNVGGGLYLEYLDDPRYEVDWVDVWQETASEEIYIARVTLDPYRSKETLSIMWAKPDTHYEGFVSLNDLIGAMDKASQLLRGNQNG
jgi:hypothetical protein